MRCTETQGVVRANEQGGVLHHDHLHHDHLHHDRCHHLHHDHRHHQNQYIHHMDDID